MLGSFRLCCGNVLSRRLALKTWIRACKSRGLDDFQGLTYGLSWTKSRSAKKRMEGMLWGKIGAKGLCPNNARTTPEQCPNNARTIGKQKQQKKENMRNNGIARTMPEQGPNSARTRPDQNQCQTTHNPSLETGAPIPHDQCCL